MERSEEFSMDQSFLQSLKEIVLSNLENEQFGAEDISKDIGLSRSQVHRKLQKINGKSITQFIREIRLEEAHRLLAGKVGTASEISYKVGFSSPTYFNKCFHEYYGYTPGEVKNKNAKSTTPGKRSVDDDTSIIPIHGKKIESIEVSNQERRDETRRKLAAIMFTDIVGYTALMGKDEDKAFDVLRKNKEIHSKIIQQFNGILTKEMGDGMLISFDLASDAVRCAIEIQKASRDHDVSLKIGIHEGEVVFKEGDVLGDGVNIASRLQSITDPGGIYISESLQKLIRGKSDIQTKYLGEFKLKNVDYPVRTYAVQGDGLPVPSAAKINKHVGRTFLNRMLRSPLLYIVFLIIILGGTWGISLRFYSDDPERPTLVIFTPEDHTGMDSIDHIISGIQSSLITELGKIGEINIISSYTSRRYKESGLSLKEIASEGNVDYILEPFLSCFENNACLKVNLIQISEEENLIWTDDYYDDIGHIFKMYNNITKEISEKVGVLLTPEEEERLAQSREVNPDAYDAFLRSHQYWDDFSEEALNEALGYLNIAVAKDPEWAPLYVGLAKVWAGLQQFGFVSPDIAGNKIDENIYKAQELDPELPDLHFVMFLDACYDYNWEKAEKEILKSLSNNPSDELSRIYYAHLLMYLQRSDEAVAQGQRAVKLDRLNPLILGLYAAVLSGVGDYQSAIAQAEKALSLYPESYGLFISLEWNYYLNADYEKSIELLKYVYPFEDEDLSIIKETFNKKGYPAAAGEIVRVWEEAFQKGGKIQPMRIANACMRAKKYNKALDWIEKGYEIHDPGIVYLGTANRYESIRNEPRIIRILKKMNLPID